jgi:hypothetical protein
VILARTFGCARFAYNHMLRLRTDAWYQRQERVGYHETSAALTALKKTPEHAWLNEVSSVPVQQALRHLQTAFANFFARRAKYPDFRRKDGVQSAEYTTSAFKWDGVSLKLAKMDAPLAIRWSRTIPKGAKVTTVTVSKDTAGRSGPDPFRHSFDGREDRCAECISQERSQARQVATATCKEAKGIRQSQKSETQSRTHPCQDGRFSQGLPAQTFDPVDQRKPSDRHRKPVRQEHAEEPISGEVDQRCKLV